MKRRQRQPPPAGEMRRPAPTPQVVCAIAPRGSAARPGRELWQRPRPGAVPPRMQSFHAIEAQPLMPVVLVAAVFEDEERFGAMGRCFGERDGFSEAFERERLALGDAQNFINDETANLG
jgi:hypothetical protein